MRGWDRWRDDRFKEMEAFLKVDDVSEDGQVKQPPTTPPKQQGRRVRHSSWMS